MEKCGEVSKPVKKRLLYKSYYVISIGSEWGKLCSFSLTSKGSVSWANILSHFHRASLTLAAPRRHTWQWQMRQCVEEWGGGGAREGGRWESQKGMAATPRRNSDSLASACCQSAPATPGPGAASVSTHFHTWTNSSTGQEKQPTHPYLSPCPPSTFPPSKSTLSGAPSAAFWPPLLHFFWSLSFRHFSCPQLAVYIYIHCAFTLVSPKNTICYIMDLCIWPLYTWFSFHNLLYVWLMCAFKKKKKAKKTLHSGF